MLASFEGDGAAASPTDHGDVFISHASEDRNVADQIATYLQSRGWSVWWDRRLVAGAAFDDAIEQALGSARCAVVLWSRSAVASRWVRAEASEAVRRHIMVPVRIDRTEIPLEFRRYQTLSLPDWHGTLPGSVLESIHHAVGQMVGARRDSAVAPAPRPLEWPLSVGHTVGLTAAAFFLFVLFVGFSSSRVYQRALGIAGRFDNETPLTWLNAGASALVLPSVYVLVFWLTVTLLIAIGRWCTRRVPAVAGWTRRVVTTFDSTPLDVWVLRALFCVVGALSVLLYVFRTQIRAIQGVAYLPDPADLAVLSPAHVVDHFAYRTCFGLLVLVCAAAIAIGIRRSLTTGEVVAWSSVFAGLAVTGASVFLWAMPHRLLWQEKHTRVTFGQERCYDVGPEGRDVLLFCPLRGLPRTLVVSRGDPRLDWSDSHTERVFAAFDTPVLR